MTAALQRETRTIPIVFVGARPTPSPAPLDRPSGNITGFANWEASMGGKWLELLSEIAPGLKRAAIMFNPDAAPAPVSIFIAHRAAVISAAARNNVPAVYWLSEIARDGGLLSYGPDPVDILRRAATYVDRILRGAKPAELPVQLPTKFELVVNLKTAKALGLSVPPSIWLRADEVID